MCDLYLDDDLKITGLIFEYCDDMVKKLYGVDIDRVSFIDSYMHSMLCEAMDDQFPTPFGRSAIDNVMSLVEDENVPLVESKEPDDFLFGELGWIGQMYVRLCYRLDIPRSELYKMCPIKTMRH